MDKLERLLNLTIVLLEAPRPLTAQEIRERVGGYAERDDAFKRAFERDKAELRSMGIPLSMSEITHTDPPAEGYRIRADDYYLRDPGFTPEELAALHLAVASVPMPGARGLEAFWNLGGVPAVVEATAVAELPTDEHLGPLFAALGARRIVTFQYGDVTRTVEPHRLDFTRGRWYLTAHDRTRGDRRTFRVDRIVGPVVAGDAGTFEPPAGRSFEMGDPWTFGEGEATEVTLRVDADHVGALDQLSVDVERRVLPDGSVEATFEVVHWPAFRWFVLGFLEHAEVVGPPDRRAAMVEWLEALA